MKTKDWSDLVMFDPKKTRLQEAAPELLEACKGHGFKFLALLDRLTEGYEITELESTLIQDQLNFMTEVIAKAEGKE